MAHSVDNYAIGKGVLYVAEWSGSTPPSESAYIDIGNCPKLDIEPKVEKLPHYSSRSEFKQKDLDPTIQTECTITFDLDEVSDYNLNMFMLGTRSGSTIQGLRDTSNTYAIKFVANNPVGKNRTYRFWKCSITPASALPLITDEYEIMSYTAECLADVANNANSPFFTVSMTTTTTTTTTTTP